MYKKVIVSGDIIEVYTMQYPPLTGKKDKDKDDFDPFGYRYQLDMDNYKDGKRIRGKEIDRVAERRKQTARDARNHVRRLALSNFTNNSKFLTLTFKRNEQDIDNANNVFKKFMRRLRKTVKKLKYIAVIEFQGRGAIHYHVICNIPYTPHKQLLEWWHKSGSDGSVNIKNIAAVDNVGAYLIKYMMKNAGDDRLKGKKMYLSSQGMDKPKTYNGYGAEIIIKEYLKQKKEIYANEYESEYLGKITYQEYNLKTNKKYRQTKDNQKLTEKIS